MLKKWRRPEGVKIENRRGNKRKEVFDINQCLLVYMRNTVKVSLSENGDAVNRYQHFR